MSLKICRRTCYAKIFVLVCVAFIFVQLYYGYSINQQPVSGLLHLEWSDGRLDVQKLRGNVSSPESDETPKLEVPIAVKCPAALSTEALHAIERAKSQECKVQLALVACQHQQAALYPQSIPRYCPLRGNTSGLYLGCFRDSSKLRIFKDYQTESNDNNSPTYCINHCLRSGFEFAGVQYRYECWCGSAMHEHSVQISEELCSSHCPGIASNSICGGYYTMNVYRTGFGVKQTNNPGYVAPMPLLNRQSEYNGVRIVFVLTVNGRAVRQVLRLLKAIYRSHHYYYIHVDSRQQYLHRELSKYVEEFVNVRIANQRYATIWGGASLLTMLLDTMTELLNFADWQWNYFLNLSESDYPVKSIEELEAFLTDNEGMNFVKSHGKDTPRFIRKQGLNMLFYECDNRMWRLGPRKLQDGIRIDGGSDWICLHRQFTQYVANGNDTLLHGLKEFWKYSLLPAESFFHTVLQNSVYCQSIVNNNLHHTNWRRKQGCKCQYKHVVDWCGCSPNDLLPSDLPKIQSLHDRPIYFARKFESVISQVVINKIDDLVYGSNLPAETPSLKSFWLNDYDREDGSSDSTSLSYYTAFAHLAVQNIALRSAKKCRLKLNKLLEATIYMYDDAYNGVIVTAEVAQNFNESNGIFTMEALLQPVAGFLNVECQSSIVDRLDRIEVGTNFDPKELVFRNFAGLIGPDTDVSIKMQWQAGPPVTGVSINILYPNGTEVLGSIEESVTEETATVTVHQLPLAKPMTAGIWTVQVIARTGKALRSAVVAKVKFLVAHNDSRFEFDSMELLASKVWRVIDFCTFSSVDHICVEKVSSCHQSRWSTQYPDPKCWLGEGRRLQAFENGIR